MRKIVCILTILISLSVYMVACQETTAAEEKTFEEAIFEAEKAAQNAAGPAEEAAIWEDIIRRYPENPKFEQIVNRYLTLVIVNKLGYEDALTLLTEIKPQVKDEQKLVHIDYSKANLLGWLKRYEESAKLYVSVSERAANENRSLRALQYAFRNAVRSGNDTLADELEKKITSTARLGYSAHIGFMQEFIKAEKWEAALHHLEGALEASSPAALQGERTGAPSESLELTSKHMQRYIRPDYAWVLFHVGRRDEAMKQFELAEAEGVQTIYGISYSPATIRHGRALMELGKTETAIDKLLFPAVIMRESEALECLQEAYLVNGGEEAKFENYVLEQRNKLAIAAPDFTLPTLDGGERSLFDFKGKVVLLNFFTPT